MASAIDEGYSKKPSSKRRRREPWNLYVNGAKDAKNWSTKDRGGLTKAMWAHQRGALTGRRLRLRERRTGRPPCKMSRSDNKETLSEMHRKKGGNEKR